MKNAIVYANFSDKFGNAYGFDNYAAFAKFWFGMKFSTAKSMFPNFWDLQRAASSSKAARATLVR